MPRLAPRHTSVRLPADTVLTARGIEAVACRFRADELHDLIERLIDRLDALTPDADQEPEPEACRA